MRKVLNFSAGPAVLPDEVLLKAQTEMFDWEGSGISVMEMSHRGTQFETIMENAMTDLRDLLELSDDYEVLFMQGGATSQFSVVPLNLMREGKSADYVCTGQWGKKALKEAKMFGKVNLVASSEETNFYDIPEFETWDLDPQAEYVHITGNETIGGVEFHWVPETGEVPLVSDMSSHFLSRHIDASKYGVFYAGAQKNVGPAGLTIVVVQRSLIGRSDRLIPSMYDYDNFAKSGSMSNTPPCFSIYVSGLVFKWLKRQGGIRAIEEKNIKKAELLYHYLDNSDFYQTFVSKDCRSRMNIPFKTVDQNCDIKFLKEAKINNLHELKGHRSVGGMRASIYNAMSIDGVKVLLDFMRDFEKKNG